MSNGLALFTQNVNGLIECKLIMVDKQIENVLKSVASISVLKQCLTDTLQVTSYVTELSRARVIFTNEKGEKVVSLKLPEDYKRLFTFVVCLLAEFSRGSKNILDFLKEYYHRADANDSYALFCETVLKPFKLAGSRLLMSIDPDSIDNDSYMRATSFFSQEPMYLNSDVLHKLLSVVQSVREQIPLLRFENSSEKENARLICDAMTNALQSKNQKLIKICWIGFDSSLKRYSQLEEPIKVLSRLLNQNNLV